MEAQLLQVTLPEIQELYQALLAKPSPAQQTGRSSPGRPGGEKVSVAGGGGGGRPVDGGASRLGGQVSVGSRAAGHPLGSPPGSGPARVSGFFSFSQKVLLPFPCKGAGSRLFFSCKTHSRDACSPSGKAC